MAIKVYTKEYAGLLAKITAKKSYFLRAFGGKLQVKDGVKDKDTFMYLKTSDTPVVMQEYSEDENVGFGTGTGSSNRFGPRNEIKSVDTSVPYEKPLSIHEGVDNFTVNDVPAQVVAERLEEQAIAWAEYIDGLLGKSLSEAASKTLDFELTEEGVTKLFAGAHKAFINENVSKNIPWVAYVNADVYDFLVDHKLATTAKNSSANIDEQSIYKFKGFLLEEMPESKFQTDEAVQFSADGVGIAGVGISITRTIDSEDFNGIAIQGAGKYGKHIPEKNKVAILKGKVKKA
jgi:hypothetical protein|nr:MAG TPA: major capsid protein [Caudoviricetes sp.]